MNLSSSYVVCMYVCILYVCHVHVHDMYVVYVCCMRCNVCTHFMYYLRSSVATCMSCMYDVCMSYVMCMFLSCLCTYTLPLLLACIVCCVHVGPVYNIALHLLHLNTSFRYFPHNTMYKQLSAEANISCNSTTSACNGISTP